MLYYASQRYLSSALDHPTCEIYDMNLFFLFDCCLVVFCSSSLYSFLLFTFVNDGAGQEVGGGFYDMTSFCCANLEAQGNKFLKEYLQHKGKVIIKIENALNLSFVTDTEEFFIKVAHTEISMTSCLVEAAKY